MVKKDKVYFLGWTNVKWFLTEMGKCLSNEKSYFSIKRVKAAIAFAILQWGMVYWLFSHMSSELKPVTAQDIAIWASIELLICGYTINTIQKEKLATVVKEDDSNEDIKPVGELKPLNPND